MRAARPLLCPLLGVLLVSGCGLGVGGSLSGKNAQSALAAKNGALAKLAQTQLTVIVQSAQQWSADHGGAMTGFADDLRTTQPALAGTFVDLSDDSVTIMVGAGQCVTAQLPAGGQSSGAC